jgi:hypothetical protein
MARRKIVAMLGLGRSPLVVILVVACAVLPLALVECDASCHAAHASIPSPSAASCHHSPSAFPEMGRPADACGHDHNAVVQAMPEVTSVHKVHRVQGVMESADPPHLVHIRHPEHLGHPGRLASHERQLISRFSPIRI